MSEDFRAFWANRGGAPAFENWRKTGHTPTLVVRVEAPHFTAGFEISDRVVQCAPILRKHIAGKTESQIRRYLAEKGWKATIIRLIP